MPIPFSRSERALRADLAGRRRVGLALGLVLLGGWLLWLGLGRVSVHEVSAQARLQVVDAAHPLQASASGRVTAIQVELGDTVEGGAVLLTLDDTNERLHLQEAEAVRDALQAQVDALELRAGTEKGALGASAAATDAAHAEAVARHQEAVVAAEFAEERARIEQGLFERGQIAAADARRARAEAQRLRSAADAAGHTLDQRRFAGVTDRRDRSAQLGASEVALARARGELAAAGAAAARWQDAVDRRRIRAPVDGTVGELAPLRVGMVLQEGDPLGSVIPAGELVVVAQFDPTDALGRIRPTQQGRLRLDGFPWAQYGSLPVRVTRVAGEMRAGAVRVDLALVAPAEASMPLQHGMSGTVEVEVERVAPAILVLRAAGGLITAPDEP